jgi:hypothetical protein
MAMAMAMAISLANPIHNSAFHLSAYHQIDAPTAHS